MEEESRVMFNLFHSTFFKRNYYEPSSVLLATDKIMKHDRDSACPQGAYWQLGIHTKKYINYNPG